MSDSCQERRMINHIIMHSADHSQVDTTTPQSGVSRVIPRQAETDEQLVPLWLHGKSVHTQRAYKSDIRQFFKFVNKPLRAVILSDLQNFSDSLDEKELSAGSKRRVLSSVKSLISFAHKLGYLVFDVSRPLILPACKDTLAERILTENEVHKIIDAENHPRNKLILKLLYISGVRVSELCGLTWKDFKERNDGGQMTVYGKGSKTRVILLPQTIWDELICFRNGDSENSPVFRSRKRKGSLHPTTVLRIVKSAALKAGINKAVSPHWMRHAHASIASEKAPLHVVQASLGHSSIQTTSRYLHVKPNDCSSKYLRV